MRKYIETLAPEMYHHVSFDGRFLMIKGRQVLVKGKVSILPWQSGEKGKKMTKRFYEKVLPLYIQLWPNVWLAIWSAPYLQPNLKPEYWKALRITVRVGKYHEKVLLVIKRGEI